jgi:hypothetical protein
MYNVCLETEPAEPIPASLRAALERALVPAPFEISDLGLYCPREGATAAAIREAERILLREGSLRTLDFNLGAEDLLENAVRGNGDDLRLYEGAPRPGGVRVFRVDHHYDVRALAAESATPLVLRWLRALHAAGRRDILAEVARSRFLADHCDADILLANHLALCAEDAPYLFSPTADALAAAALRNDYVLSPPPEREPWASKAFYACLGIDTDVRARRLPFHEALRTWLASLGPWLEGRAGAEVARRLDAWEARARAREAAHLAAIEGWIGEGRLARCLGGRAIFLDAPRKIDNAEFFLFVLRRPREERPVVQVLRYPEQAAPQRFVYKVRAHGGFDLHPLLSRLQAEFPEAGFAGRSAALGSRPTAPIDPEALMATIEKALGAPPDRDRGS